MAEPEEFVIRAGMPYSASFRVIDGKDVWGDLADFEVRSQARNLARPESTLILNLHPFMTKAYGTGAEDNDIIITLTMDGEDTAPYAGRTGYFDVILSDTGTVDGHAVPIGPFPVRFPAVVTRVSGDT